MDVWKVSIDHDEVKADVEVGDNYWTEVVIDMDGLHYENDEIEDIDAVLEEIDEIIDSWFDT